MSELTVYVVAKGHTVWSQSKEKYFHEGEVLDFSKAKPEDIEAVLKSGAVVKQAAPVAAKENK